MAAGLVLRDEQEGDLPLLLAWYRSTRAEELTRVDWTEEQKTAFVSMQFAAQRHHYRHQYPGARFQIIERDRMPIGRLYVHERDDEIRVMDILVAPEARNQGVGSALMGDVLERGARSRRPITIHVERFNPARQLWERLGFRQVGAEPDDSVYLLLEARPWADTA